MGISTKFRELSLFSGTGGGLLASKWFLGWRTVCYVEWERYCIDVLRARIRDGLLDDAPIWDDARTFDGRPWCGCVDIITAGFPCQPFSTAGRRKGKDDPRNMWPDTIRIIREVRPRWVLLENVSGLRCCRRKKTDSPSQEAGYFGTVLGDLAKSGYDGRWKVLSAAEVGAAHKRDRVWILAYAVSDDKGSTQREKERRIPNTKHYNGYKFWNDHRDRSLSSVRRWASESRVDGIVYGVAHRVDRLKAIGNGQVPLVVATVWDLLTEDTTWIDKEHTNEKDI